ncbi:uncharacterized protein METZ01_LOCUS59236 [marine metagenome]|uniref:Uncharacterized protein n=1 Tax=marine metagenome TaxID=408172 RepID=A0A381SQW0_9ZZZZ
MVFTVWIVSCVFNEDTGRPEVDKG